VTHAPRLTERKRKEPTSVPERKEEARVPTRRSPASETTCSLAMSSFFYNSSRLIRGWLGETGRAA
jgi:hypothetical protein